MEKRGHKESISSNGDRSQTGRTEDAWAVSEEELELALSKLQAIVEGEPVPSVWQNPSTVQGSSGVSVVSGLADPAGSSGISGSSGVAGSSDIPGISDISGVASLPEDINRAEHPSSNASSIANASASASAGAENTVPRPLSTAKWKRSHRRTWRKAAWSTATAVVVIGLLASPLGGKAMAAAMQTLYFHHIVGVGQSDINQIQQALYTGGMQSIDLKQYGSVDVSGNQGGQKNVTLQDASQLMGFQVKTLPGFDPKVDNLNYTPSSSVTFRLNVQAINQLVSHLGGKVGFPESVNQEPITVQVPAQIYEFVPGNHPDSHPGSQVSLAIRKMPTIQVPDNVDLNQVRSALMGLPFLPSDIRQSLQTQENWQDTLYLPVGGKSTDMTINGYSAILQTYPNNQQRSIFWLENGVLYQLSGSGSAFPTDASIISLAKELSQ